MKKISVVVPVFNGEKYIDKCIKSIHNQTLDDIEIILINDGSTDKTGEICLEMSKKYKNLKYYQIENLGCSFARNYGITKAVGKYITFVDSDDWVDQEMYLDMYLKAEEESLDILICGYKKVDSNNKILLEILPELKNRCKDYMSSKLDYFNSPWNKIYKTSLIKNNNIKFLEKCHMGEDMLFNFQAFNYAKEISVIPKSYYNYFINNNSVMYNPNKKVEIYLAINEIKKLKIESSILDECIRYHGIIYPFGVIELVKENKGNWKKYYIEFIEEIKKLENEFSLKTKLVLLYRKIRLNFVFLKKILRRCIM